MRCSYERLQANQIQPKCSKRARHAKATQQRLNGGTPDGAQLINGHGIRPQQLQRREPT
jgi:hypothetical protein